MGTTTTIARPVIERDVARANVDGKTLPVSRWFRQNGNWLVLVPTPYGQHVNGARGPLDCEAREGDRVLVQSKNGHEQTVTLGAPRGGYGLGGKLFDAIPGGTA